MFFPPAIILMLHGFVGWGVSGGVGGMGVVDQLWWSAVVELVRSRRKWQRALRGRGQVWDGVFGFLCYVWFWAWQPEDSAWWRGWRRIRAQVLRGGRGRGWVTVNIVDRINGFDHLGRGVTWTQEEVRVDALRLWIGAVAEIRMRDAFPLEFV
jgi:hypothetical protein